MTMKRPKTARCGFCKARLKIKPRGRVPTFCSQGCRQRAYQRRRWQRPHPIELLARDLATVQVRDVIRAEIWAIMVQLGWVDERAPAPKPPRTGPKPPLRLVEPTDND
jgi:hypothetical protein